MDSSGILFNFLSSLAKGEGETGTMKVRGLEELKMQSSCYLKMYHRWRKFQTEQFPSVFCFCCDCKGEYFDC